MPVGVGQLKIGKHLVRCCHDYCRSIRDHRRLLIRENVELVKTFRYHTIERKSTGIMTELPSKDTYTHHKTKETKFIAKKIKDQSSYNH